MSVVIWCKSYVGKLGIRQSPNTALPSLIKVSENLTRRITSAWSKPLVIPHVMLDRLVLLIRGLVSCNSSDSFIVEPLPQNVEHVGYVPRACAARRARREFLGVADAYPVPIVDCMDYG